MLVDHDVLPATTGAPEQRCANEVLMSDQGRLDHVVLVGVDRELDGRRVSDGLARLARGKEG